MLDLASQEGLLRASDLYVIDAPRVVLTRLVAAGLLDRVGRGLYRLPSHPVSEHESLVVVAATAPQAVWDRAHRRTITIRAAGGRRSGHAGERAVLGGLQMGDAA